MKERDFQKKLLSELRAHAMMKDAVIFKHNDFYTAGIPDISITLAGKTTWFELKVFPNAPTKLQAYFLKRLQPRSYVVTLMANGEIFIDRHEGLLTMYDTINVIAGLSTICLT